MPDILNYPPTKSEQEVIAWIRKILYGEVTAKIQNGKIVLIEHKATEKVQQEAVPYCNYK